MNTETELIISSALDGERTDIGTLRAALATEEGKEILASFVLLRAQVAADDLRPSKVLHAAEARDPQALSNTLGTQPLRRLNRWFPVPVGALFATVLLACGFWLGHAWRAGQYSTNPAQNPTVAGQRAESQGPIAITETARTSYGSDKQRKQSQSEPPKPTRVLRFVPGTDWHSNF